MPAHQQFMTRLGKSHYEFHPPAVDIFIYNRRGRLVWRNRRGGSLGPIRWAGDDLEGRAVELGEYVCKIRYLDGQTFYVPFVFL